MNKDYRKLVFLAVLQCAAVAVGSPCLAATSQEHRTTVGNPSGRGFLFVDGEVIAPPYEIALAPGGRIDINGQRFRCADYMGVTISQPAQRRGWFWNDVARTDRLRDSEQLKSELQMALQSPDQIVVLTKAKPPVFLDSASDSDGLIDQLSRPTDQRDASSLLAKFVSSESEALATLLADFTPSNAFLLRAAEADEAAARVESVNAESSRTFLAMNKVAYPMTMVAMILVAIGFGHLLSNKPMLGEGEAQSAHSRSVVFRSVLIFLLLSAIDLFWTMLASQSGTMRELNPIGNGFIRDPVQLVAFKFAVVGMSSGILMYLHDRSIAQAASWWSCLVLTLLTARWVVFQSMMF